MAARRKLQSEIDICLKKVDEGLEYFHELWDKAHKLWEKVEQREKIASELKKEIKKLQRHREQVKNWVTKHPDLLNKEPLIEARRKIEKEMERFKNFEKEVKTKTYSKVGLSLKRNKLAPEQRDAIDWISEQREALEEQQEDLEQQIDKLQRKNRKKKSALQAQQEDVLIKRLDKHKWHVSQMKDLAKRIEKGRVAPQQLEALKDDIVYYVEEAVMDEEFWDNDLLYDAIEELEVGNDDPEEEEEEERTPSPVPVKKKEKRKKKKKEKVKKPKKRKKEKESEPTPLKIIPTATSPVLHSVSPATTVSITQSEPTPIFLPSVPSDTNKMNTHKPGSGVHPSPSLSAQTLSSLPSIPPTPGRQESSHSNSNAPRIPDFQSIMLEEERRQKKQKEAQKQREALNAQNGGKDEITNVWSAGTPFNRNQNKQDRMMQNFSNHVVQSPIAAHKPEDRVGGIHNQNYAPSAGHYEPPPLPTPTQPTQKSRDGNLTNQDELLSKFGKYSDKYKSQLQKVQYAFTHMPIQTTQMKKAYFPRNPVRVPDCFPHNTVQYFDDPDFISKYDVDTLFFMFHYSQGTHQQYLAAQELKKRSWRYHKKFLTWFQRHTEPTEATNEYEKGAYIYFDYESSWCQRVKSDFCFEYQYLEDS